VTFVLSRWLFLRLLGVVYLIAFVSLAVQITALVGERGILPVGQYLSQARAVLGAEAYRVLPTLVWFSPSDTFLLFLCWAGAVLSILLIAGIFPGVICVPLWAFYLSVTVAGQVFLEFQWDMLLLETGLLACLYAPYSETSWGAEPNTVVRWVLWALAFKLTFLSGITKILSGDPTWADWTAMTYHYQTQPIPAWTSWYAHHLPAPLQHWSVPAMFAVELLAPFAAIVPARFRRTRLIGVAAMILLQVAVGTTGNYGFFNLLAIVLYVSLLDDRTLRNVPRLQRAVLRWAGVEPSAWRRVTAAAALLIASVSVVAFIQEMQATAGTSAQISQTPVGTVLNLVSPFRSVNGYGLFRVMTTKRPEIIVEVSADGQEWREQEFRWKPGDLNRRPPFVAPHMPRLDWQMWFAALDPGRAEHWMQPLVSRVLSGEPAVLRLLEPSPLSAAPKFVRLVYYEYRFTTPSERSESGAWWTRQFIGYLTSPIAAP